LTVINPTLEAKKISIDGKTIVVAPEQHFTQKGMKKGKHQIQIGSNVPMNIEIQKKRSTLIDLGGDNCFVVADYTDQYGESGTGSVKVVEKFVNEKSFTTSGKVTSQLSEPLPEGVGGHKTITRIHRVDCAWIDNDQAIIDAIANLP